MKNIACLALAAGRSSRMASANKLLLPFGATSVIARTIGEVCAADFCEVVVVTGHDRDEIESELANFPVHFAPNPNYMRGMHSSICRGLLALSPKVEGVAILLGDLPLLRSTDLQMMIEAAADEDPRGLLIPKFEGRKGHPVIISTKYKDEILAEPDADRGCSYLFERHPADVRFVELHNEGILKDIDTRSTYESLLAESQPISSAKYGESWHNVRGN